MVLLVCLSARQPGHRVLNIPEQERQVQWCGHREHSLGKGTRLSHTWQVGGEVFVRSVQPPIRYREVTGDI